MKHLFILFFALTVFNCSFAQGTDTNYALPSVSADVSNNASNTPGYMVTLQEGGTVPSEAKSTCDGKADGSFKSTAGISLQHYYDKQQMKQMSDAYASIGGMKGVFVKGLEDEYKDYENGMQPGPILNKGQLQTGALQGAEVRYFTVTYGCIQNTNEKATKIIYKAMLLTETDYLIIDIEIYSANADMARKYAEEIIAKIKSLDYGKVK